MATVFEDCTAQELCSAVRFLWARGLNAEDVHTEMFPVYGEKCLSLKAIDN
jgi:hypothetical protein